MRAHRRLGSTDSTWPGFVDALSTLLLVIIFLLVVFVLAQFILSQAVSKKDEALQSLQIELDELRMMLNLERATSEQLQSQIQTLSASLESSEEEKQALNLQIINLTERAESAEQQVLDLRAQFEGANAQLAAEADKLSQTLDALADKDTQISALESDLTEARATSEAQQNQIIVLGEDLDRQIQLTNEATAQVALLNQQLSALRAQLASLQQALEASEAKNKEQQAQIADLGRRLNVALASKVQELKRYRSEFFGRLREALGNRDDIQVVGDRFVFQSEVLFGSGSADLGADGQQQLATLARTLADVAKNIPSDLNWILRIDGHTDSIPINNINFRNNWELSSARALSVVENLIVQGIAPERLAATGFGEYHPIDTGTGPSALRRNRRIEIKLTER